MNETGFREETGVIYVYEDVSGDYEDVCSDNRLWERLWKRVQLQ